MSALLKEPFMRRLPVTNIKPQGWLRDQLEIQAKGLSGNLDQFWPDIKDSRWIGGTAEGWERAPYWLDGFIPLAWLLDDDDMKERANNYINHIIANQAEDGWLCPCPNEARGGYDLWAAFLILKVLVVYHDATSDDRIESVVYNALKNIDRHIDGSTLFGWGQTRWYECLISIWWLYERRQEQWLLDLSSKLAGQGFDWLGFFTRWPYKTISERNRWSQMSHVVNNAMMLKSGALLWRMTGDNSLFSATKSMVDLLDEYHGMVTGVFTGDECLAGTDPTAGTELCAVAEYMYSLEELLATSGDPAWGERLELISFNALPATFSPDMWSHQYDQQVNQVECSKRKTSPFGTNGGDAHTFGLEPNYGCCTANLSQAWPKLASSAVMHTSTDSGVGIAIAAYLPCQAATTVNDTPVCIDVTTDYPFKDRVSVKVKVDSPVEFTLKLRIPEWAEGANIQGVPEAQGTHAIPGTWFELKQLWQGETLLTIHLPMKPVLIPRPNNLFAIKKGPLVYSLVIGEKWVQINQDVPGHEKPHCDYEVLPTTPWNYGLKLSLDSLEKDLLFEEFPVSKTPFSPEGAPVIAWAQGSKVDWEMCNGVAATTPNLSWVSEEVETLKLIPYGCTNLRLTEMPLLSK